jgi:hypothetical protein
MIENSTLSKEKIMLMEQDSRMVCNVKVDYYLYGIVTLSGKKYYAVEAVKENEAVLETVSCDMVEAQALYFKSVCGEVTPRTLGDVVQDAKIGKKY